MLTITDGRKMRWTLALALVGLGLLAASWAVRGGYLRSDCAERLLRNTEELKCVAEQAKSRSSVGAPLVIAALGIGALVGASALGARSLQRVMSLHEAAEQLDTSVSEVRAAIENGSMRAVKRDIRGTSVRTEDVLRHTAISPTLE